MFKINFKNYKIPVIFLSVIIAVATGFLIVSAGSLTPTGVPGSNSFHDLEEIYCKMMNCSPRTYVASDSPGTPASTTPTMYTIKDINDVAPDFRTSPPSPGYAASSEVCNSRNFYTNSSTPQTGVSGTGTYCCAQYDNNNQSCTEPDQCISGNCVDGYCCNSRWDVVCHACSIAAGAASNDTCGYVAAGTPDPGCPSTACPVVLKEAGSWMSCATKCATYTHLSGKCVGGSANCAPALACGCSSIGSDSAGTNGQIIARAQFYCYTTAGATCATVFGVSYGTLCAGPEGDSHSSNWSRCRCN